MSEEEIGVIKKNVVFSVIIFMFVLLLLWYYVKNELLFNKNKSCVDGFNVSPGRNVNYSGVNSKIMDYNTPLDYKNVQFVSGIHEYYPPFTKVLYSNSSANKPDTMLGDTNLMDETRGELGMNNGAVPYIPIRNTRLDYFSQNLKFR